MLIISAILRCDIEGLKRLLNHDHDDQMCLFNLSSSQRIRAISAHLASKGETDMLVPWRSRMKWAPTYIAMGNRLCVSCAVSLGDRSKRERDREWDGREVEDKEHQITGRTMHVQLVHGLQRIFGNGKEDDAEKDTLNLLGPHIGEAEALQVLSDAVESGDRGFVRWCLDQDAFRTRGPEVYSSQRDVHYRPLWVALYHCPMPFRPSIVKVLLDYRFDVNDARPYINKTLLQQAVINRDYDTAKLLIEYRADVNEGGSGLKEDRNKPPLALALEKPVSVSIVDLLLRNGARKRWTWFKKDFILKVDDKAVGCLKMHFVT